MKTKFICLLAVGCVLCEINSFCHDRPVHQAITVKAAESAYDGASAYRSFVSMISSELPYLGLGGATNYLAQGSFEEDNIGTDDGGARSLNHFYDPLSALGLSNTPIPPDDRIAPYGKNSFLWASTLNCPGIDAPLLDFLGIECLRGNVGTYNQWSWKNARDYEWHGLTEASATARHDALANMFRAVGQVMHLLEDASQPQHVRNEQHLDKWPCLGTPTRFLSPIEEYGRTNVDNLNYQSGILDWKNAGFTKLEDFWDRNLYNGTDSQGLVNDAKVSQPQPVGLAEFANGNFLGVRHLYPEYSSPGKVAYYPFPSRDKSTNFEQVKADPALGLETFTLANQQQVKGIYIKKNGDGITVNHFSRINYLGAKKLSGLTGRPFCTIADDKVLADYHAILIPKAVEYSAGLLDYRGGPLC